MRDHAKRDEHGGSVARDSFTAMSMEKGGAANPVAIILDDRIAPPDVPAQTARLADLTAFVGGILFEVDQQGRFLGVWTGEPELLYRPPEELRGRTVTDVMGQGLGEQFLGIFKNVFDTGVAQTFDYVLDVPAGRRNFRCEVRLTPRRATSDEPRTLTLFVRDITEETELRAKLVEAERLAAMGLVAASIGHEIRQPLAFATTSIEVLARELARSAAPSQQADEALDHVRDALRRIAGIASSVGVVAPDRQRDTTTDIRRPIQAALDLCASELQGRAKIAASIPELPRVRANEGELCQVITNVLLNAAHAVNPTRSTTRISIAAQLTDGGSKVQIMIEDDGCGIDPAVVARVFDPFFSTKAPGRGTGLGLFVSKRIVEAAGGQLEIDSRLNEGTTVSITLPAATVDIATPASQPLATSRRCTILVVDDEPAFLRSLELVLEDTHDVVVSARSADALELVRSNPQRFDAILCDLSMPEIDGVAFHAHLETLGLADRFLLMTAGAFTPRGEAFVRQAKCRRIGKPFTPEQLLSVLGGMMSRSAAAAAPNNQARAQ